MFTGLVDDVGTIERVATTAAGREFRLRTRYRDLAAGESVALNGACLTVLTFGDGWFTCAAMETTRARTTCGAWREGQRVNLERAMRADGRFGGHLVQGHVDGVGEVTGVVEQGDALLVDVALPEAVAEVTVLHGSITVDGVSLTVNALLPQGVQLALIDFTRRHTTLGELRPGDRVHLEADVIGKYVQRLLGPHAVPAGAVAISPE
jgi:riboflavin synthase